MIAEKAYAFLADGFQSKKPFFLAIAPIAPHSNVDLSASTPGNHADPKDIHMTAPIPAERHKHLFPNAKVPRRENFNPDKVLDHSLALSSKNLTCLGRWSVVDQTLSETH